jgi:hypothetical protein
MHLLKVEDFRDCLEKATRSEITKFADARGVKEIDPRMGAILMRQILRAKNITDIDTMFPRLRSRRVGQINGVNATAKYAGGDSPNVAQITAAEDLARQWQEQQAREGPPPAPVPSSRPANRMAALRAECKRHGIKMSRTDKIADLRAKLDGENAAQRSQ